MQTGIINSSEESISQQSTPMKTEVKSERPWEFYLAWQFLASSGFSLSSKPTLKLAACTLVFSDAEAGSLSTGFLVRDLPEPYLPRQLS